MAQLDLQEKRGVNPLWWILGLIILALLAWWIFSSMNRTPATTPIADTTAAVVTPATTAPSAVAVPVPMTIAAVTAAPTPADLVGRSVTMQNVPVQSVVSDKGFWVGTSEAERVFVVLPEVPTPGTPVEGRYNVNPGQQLTLFGTVERMPADLTQQTTTWNLKSTDAAALAGHPVYVRADSLNILSR